MEPIINAFINFIISSIIEKYVIMTKENVEKWKSYMTDSSLDLQIPIFTKFNEMLDIKIKTFEIEGEIENIKQQIQQIKNELETLKPLEKFEKINNDIQNILSNNNIPTKLTEDKIIERKKESLTKKSIKIQWKIEDLKIILTKTTDEFTQYNHVVDSLVKSINKLKIEFDQIDKTEFEKINTLKKNKKNLEEKKLNKEKEKNENEEKIEKIEKSINTIQEQEKKLNKEKIEEEIKSKILKALS